jgi:hypothetical protein
VRIGQTSTLAQGLSLIFRTFGNADTSIGKLLQYGTDGVIEFLQGGFAKFADGLPTIKGLKDFADRFKSVSEVADVLSKPENITLVSSLSQHSEVIGTILEVGTQSLEAFARRSRAGDDITPWLQRLENLTLSEGKEVLGIYSLVEQALSSTDVTKVLEGTVAQIVQGGAFDVASFGKKFGPNGSIGEIDVEVSKAIIEVSVAQSDKLSQITKLLSNNTMNPTGKLVILYAPNYLNTAANDITSAGAYVVRTPQELTSLLSQL